MGIWDPGKKFFVWLDPDGWIVESYSWSLNGHLIAFSGRTENDTDVTVEVVDAGAPEQSRKIIYKGIVPIRSLAFLPGDEQLAVGDKEGNISIVQISNGQILMTGRQENLNKLFSTQNAFYSSSPNLFKAWSARPSPSRHWLFKSSQNRIYRATAGADPTWNWLAVPFVENKTTGGLELRKILTGEVKELPVPDNDSLKLQFSEDGKWLILETFKNLRVYNTDSWKHTDFALQQNDRQFIGLKLVGNTINARVLGKNYMSDTSNQFSYIINLDGAEPILSNRLPSKDKDEDKPDQELIKEDIAGWEFGTLYKYRSSGFGASPNSGWAYYIMCRDQALGARDCDVQFLPRDLNRTMNLFDSLLWMPTNTDSGNWFDEYVRGSVQK